MVSRGILSYPISWYRDCLFLKLVEETECYIICLIYGTMKTCFFPRLGDSLFTENLSLILKVLNADLKICPYVCVHITIPWKFHFLNLKNSRVICRWSSQIFNIFYWMFNKLFTYFTCAKSQNVKGILMWNLQLFFFFLLFIRRRRYWQIFQSALVCLWQWYCIKIRRYLTLTFSCVMLKNGQTYFKNLVRPFFTIMHERVNFSGEVRWCEDQK